MHLTSVLWLAWGMALLLLPMGGAVWGLLTNSPLPMLSPSALLLAVVGVLLAPRLPQRSARARRRALPTALALACAALASYAPTLASPGDPAPTGAGKLIQALALLGWGLHAPVSDAPQEHAIRANLPFLTACAGYLFFTCSSLVPAASDAPGAWRLAAASIFSAALILLVALFLRWHATSTLTTRDTGLPTEWGAGSDKLGRLTPREREVVSRLLAGASQSGIARDLGIKPSTVGTYKSRACEKLGVSSLDELTYDAVVAQRPEANDGTPSPTRVRLKVTGAALVFAAALASGLLRGLRQVQLISPLVLLGLGVAACTVAAGRNTTMTPADRADSERRPWDSVAALCGALVLRGIAYASLPAFVAVLVLIAVSASWAVIHACRPSTTGADQTHLDAVGPLAFFLGTCVSLSPASPDIVSLDWLDIEPRSIYLVASLVLVVSQARAAYLAALSRADASDGPQDESRSLFYLRSQGLGDLEAKAVLMTARGESRAAVCDRLCISEGTLNSYRRRGYARLGVHSREELAHLLSRSVSRRAGGGGPEEGILAALVELARGVAGTGHQRQGR